MAGMPISFTVAARSGGGATLTLAAGGVVMSLPLDRETALATCVKILRASGVARAEFDGTQIRET